MTTAQENQVVRTGIAHVKGNKLDPVYQDFAVREWSDGCAEYVHKDSGKWMTLPDSWRDQIAWDETAKA